VIARRGVDATRFLDVAAETGTAVSTLQYSFGSREDLITAALEAAAWADVERVRTACALASGPADKLRALVLESCAADSAEAAREASLIWVEYWRAAARDEELRTGSAAVYAEWRAMVSAILADGWASGVFSRDLDVDPAVTQVLALLDGVGVPLVLEHPGMTSAYATDVVLDALARILQCPSLSSGIGG